MMWVLFILLAAGINAYWLARERESNSRLAELQAGLKAGLSRAVDDAWGQEESAHWMRDWCPGCEHIWSSLSHSGICAWCCFGGPNQPDHPAFYQEMNIDFTEEEGEDEICEMYGRGERESGSCPP